MNYLLSSLRPTVTLLLSLSIIFGVVYPALSTVALQTFFPNKANASFIIGKNGEVLGSELIGQNFTDPKYFWGRLSATASLPYNASASGGSNLSPANPALLDAVKARIDALKKTDADNTHPIPVDLVTASASGLDPDISVAATEYQISRIAKTRNISQDTVRDLVKRFTIKRDFAILGESRVNVLKLNLALDGKM